MSLLVLVLFPLQLQAQLTRGAIAGTIRDESGAVVPGATVRANSVGTNISREATTDEGGFYRIGALEPGAYIIEVEKTGFTKAENRSLQVNTATEVTFDVNLTVGSVTETVDVTAETEAITLNKTNATVGTTIETRRVVELPLGATRNVNNLALLSPNVFSAPGSSGISANGQRARNNNFTIDGSDNNDITVTIPTVPVIAESVDQFQIQTNPYSAENGRNSGAAVNVTTKTGTNQFRGSVWDYYRGSDLNALDNIEKSAGLTRPTRFNRNQFGFNIGGPIYFLNFGEGGPTIYDGRDRTFFFYLFQGDRTRTGASQGGTIRIPTPAGFAALNSVPLRAPTATVPGQTVASRQNVLQQLAFLQGIYAQNPTFRNLTNVTVNGVAIQTGQTNIGISQPTDAYNHTFRFDHKITDNDNLTVRYINNKSDSLNAASNLNFGNIFSGDVSLKDQNLAISETHVFNSSLINEFRFSYIGRILDFPENAPDLSTVTIGGLFTFGGLSNFPQSRITDFYQFADTLSFTTGKHTFKFGADVRRNLFDNFSGFDVKGTFGFSSLQDFLNNNATSFAQASSAADFLAKQTQQFYFVQDDWRITPSLTLNLGLRYELANIPFGFFGTTDPQQNAALIPRPVKSDKNNFAPVFGFAYSPRFEGDGLMARAFGNGLTSIRGGFRTAYDVLFFNILTVNAGNFPFTTTTTQTNVVDVFPNLAPPTSTPVFNPLATFVNSPEDLKNPESYLYSLSVQREIARQFVLEVGYTGSRSINQINQLQLNPAILTDAQRQTVLTTRNANSIPSAQARRIFPQFGPRILIASTAQATYNAGYVSLKKRFSNNLLFDIAYTRSKLLSNNDESLGVGAITAGSPQIPQDFNNYTVEKSVSAFDRPNRFVANFLYEVPLPGFLENNAFTKFLFGGFQASGIFTYQSGQPFTILTGVDSNGNGSAGDRPNFNPNGIFTRDPVTGGLRSFTSPLVGGQYQVPLGTNGLPLANSLGSGNLGRNTLRAEGFFNTDFSVAKRFVLPFGGSERHNLFIRADFLNAFNQDNYGIPVNNMNSVDFGRNLNNFGNRSITLSAKYNF
ncbi:MAG: carboxypeptidase regulatory-like domain-containing protein [Acidobacteriota bacterium]|nr:carboxypeptidase regulatory-like domain-containing protein [Acidobacteriota bacterium]